MRGNKILKSNRMQIMLGSIFFILVAIIVDGSPEYINLAKSIKEGYIYYIYTALVTTAVLSTTILTVIVNSFHLVYFGFSVKEIVNFENEYFRISYAVPVTLSSILLGSFFLAFNMTISIFVLLVCVVIFIISLSNYIWQVVSSDSKCTELVYKEMKLVTDSKDDTAVENLLERLFHSFTIRANERGIVSAFEILDIISETIEHNKVSKELGQFLYVKICDVFYLVNEQVGYLPAIDKVLSLNNYIISDYKTYERYEILIKPLEKLKYLNNKDLQLNNLVMITKGLENQTTLKEKEKSFILFNFFKNIYLNEILSKKVRKSLLEDLLEHLCNFSWSKENEYDRVRQETLMFIMKDYVLLNEEDENKKIVIAISKYLYSDGYSESQSLFETIALLYFSLYQYCEKESQTLNIEHRKKIRLLMEIREDDIHTIKISFRSLILTYFKQCVVALWNLTGRLNIDYKHFEYFPPNFGSKSEVWTDVDGISFAFYNYLLADYAFEFPPFEIVADWENNTLTNKYRYIDAMLNIFDPVTKRLKINALNELENLSKWIGKEYSLRLDVQETIFEALNNEMKKIDEQRTKDTMECTPEVKKINIELKDQLLEKRKFYGYNNKLPIETEQVLYLKPQIEELRFCNNELNIAAKISVFIDRLINDEIVNILEKVELNFDDAGVKKLLRILKRNKFNKRNYAFIDDYALSKECTETPEFEELKSIINDISYVDISPIRSKIFFEEEKLKYNITIISYSYEQLNDDECALMAENFKVSDGLYKILNAYSTRSEAMLAILKNYRKQIITLKVGTNISKDSGVRIEFKR